MFKVLLVVGITVLAISTSFAAFYAGIEVGSGGFSIAGGIDGGNYLAEIFISPSTVFSVGVGGTYLLGDIYAGKFGNNTKLSVHWGVNGSFSFASAYSISVWGIGVGPALVERLNINGIKLLSSQVVGLTYTPGVYGYGGGIKLGFMAGVYYEF